MKVMVLLPWVSANPLPETMTCEPAEAEYVERPVMTGITRKEAALLGTALTVTTMLRLPAASELGTVAVMAVSLQEETDAVAEPKETKLAPWAAPKFAPEIVMGVPPAPSDCERLEMEGAD